MKFDDGEEAEEEEKDELERVEEGWTCPIVAAAPCAEKAGVVSPIGTIPVLLVRT
jgi:hypothetical protein